MQGSIATTQPIAVPAGWSPGRAEIVFEGVEQAGPSFEGRVFLNRPDADERAPLAPEHGYAGSFDVFGYGEPAPPAIAEARAAGAPGPLAPIEKRVLADDAALRRALAEAAGALTVTVVAVPVDPQTPVAHPPFQRVSIVFD